MRYLIRGAISPLTSYEPDLLAKRDIIGSNSGNLLYLYSVCRSLYCEDISIDMDEYKVEAGKYTDADIEKINSTYTAYICPLADAFRNDFIEKLNNYSRFFSKLRIPVVIPGIGLRAPLNVDLAGAKFKFDDAARKFIQSALDRGAIVGLRGEITGKYLENLGFQAEKDYTVIGCPSMYTHGKSFPMIESPKISPNSRIIVNSNFNKNDLLSGYLDSVMKQYPNSVFVGQHTDDFNVFYYGIPHHPELELYPNNASHFMIAENRMRFYVHAKQWIDDIRDYQFSIGNRLHGNIASLLAGIPAILFLSDARSYELSKYHGLPSAIAEDTIYQGMDLQKLADRIDFSTVNRQYASCYRHYIEFLKMNGLKTDDTVPSANFDSVIQVPDLLKPYVKCTPQEAAERFAYFHGKYVKVIKTLRNDISTQKKELAETKQKNQALQNDLSKQKKELDDAKQKNQALQTAYDSVRTKLKDVLSELDHIDQE